ncbi:MAG: hypothetical protein HKO62_03135 [Gammaproteobacteria bacterium]|nr:hypothetical protein [Gammaproteobacteria bacterium]
MFFVDTRNTPAAERQHNLLLIWLTLTGVIVFGFVVCVNEGFVRALISGDVSKISVVIALIYLIGTLHCAKRVAYLSRELEFARQIDDICLNKPPAHVNHTSDGGVVLDGTRTLPASLAADYLFEACQLNNMAAENAPTAAKGNLAEIFAQKAKGPHDLGWFLTDLLLKLGLLGTIIGFILMLGSVADTASLDVNTMQKVLKQMSSGMGTALFTTLAGLVGSILLGAQYLLLDKAGDELIERTVRVTEVFILPRLSRESGES